jgi:hypothetical protein
MSMTGFIRAAFAALMLAPPVLAQSPADSPIEEIVVSGEFAGPGMWKITRPADAAGHVLWIIGDPPPLPKRLAWRSRAVESVVLSSQEILIDAAVSVKPDEKIGVFRELSLLPAAFKARKNPGDRKLAELVPADVYARWRVQKQKFLGHDSAIENWRPLFAANKLRKAAIEELKLREGGMVWEVVSKLAKDHAIRTTAPQLGFIVKTGEIKSKIREFSRESLSDLECFESSIAFTEMISSRDVEQRRARAWATADLDELAALPPLPNYRLACITAFMGSQVAREFVPADINEQLSALWLRDVERALGANQSTFAIVPLAKLTRADGYLARLRALGYGVEAPR